MESRGNKQFCIVIPIYKEQLDPIEELSLKRLWDVIKYKHYNCYFVCPTDFDTSEYYNILSDTVAASKYFKEVYFDKSYFESTSTYSQLCISYDFYNKFSEYEYMYIFQLDVYLVNDNFSKFCDLGIDYIGSPVFSTDCGWTTIKNGKYTPVVGNGGFSLRKIETFKDITNPNGEYRTYYELTDKELKQIIYEDLYFCEYVKPKYKFTTANIQTAITFAWDMSADVIYNTWDIKTLPMALHAWDKNIRLYKDIIPELKENDIIISFCEEKHKDFFKVYYNENNSSIR